MLDYYPHRGRLTFQVDVFEGYGQLPKDLEEVSERENDIRYSSRTRASASKDYEFSRGTMNARLAQGIFDASTTLRTAPWLASKPRDVGRVFDVVHDVLVRNNQATIDARPADGDRTDTPPTN